MYIVQYHVQTSKNVLIYKYVDANLWTQSELKWGMYPTPPSPKKFQFSASELSAGEAEVGKHFSLNGLLVELLKKCITLPPVE